MSWELEGISKAEKEQPDINDGFKCGASLFELTVDVSPARELSLSPFHLAFYAHHLTHGQEALVSGLEMDRSSHHAKGSPATTPQLRQIGDRLTADSWHIDAVLPPHAGEMVYEDLQPVADAMQGSGTLNGVCVLHAFNLFSLPVPLIRARKLHMYSMYRTPCNNT